MTQTDPACGNGPRMSRRTLLAALPAAAAAGPAAAAPTSPVMLIFGEWQEKRRRANRPDLPEEDRDRAVDQMLQLEDDILKLPSRSAQDFAAKVAAITSFGDFGFPEGANAFMDEMHQLLGLPPGRDAQL